MAGTHWGVGRSLFGSVVGTELTGVLEEVCLALWRELTGVLEEVCLVLRRELNSPGCWKKFVWFCDGNCIWMGLECKDC